MNKFWNLYNKKLNLILSKKSLRNTNPNTVNAAFILIPYLIIVTALELLFRRKAGENNKN